MAKKVTAFVYRLGKGPNKGRWVADVHKGQKNPYTLGDRGKGNAYGYADKKGAMRGVLRNLQCWRGKVEYFFTTPDGFEGSFIFEPHKK